MDFKDHLDRRLPVTENNGYRFVYTPGHPRLSEGHNRIAEHQYLIELELGRYLEKYEVVHHLDGSRNNNRISNIVVMTRDHHTRLHAWLAVVLPDTFNPPAVPYGKFLGYCKNCGMNLQDGKTSFCSMECKSTVSHETLANRVSKEDLIFMLKDMSFVNVGKYFGVSDNAVRRWCKRYGIDYKKIVSDKKFVPYEVCCSNTKCLNKILITDGSKVKKYCGESCRISNTLLNLNKGRETRWALRFK